MVFSLIRLYLFPVKSYDGVRMRTLASAGAIRKELAFLEERGCVSLHKLGFAGPAVLLARKVSKEEKVIQSLLASDTREIERFV